MTYSSSEEFNTIDCKLILHIHTFKCLVEDIDEGIPLESRSQVHGHTLPVGKRSPEQNYNPLILKSFGASSNNGMTDIQSTSRAQSPGCKFFR